MIKNLFILITVFISVLVYTHMDNARPPAHKASQSQTPKEANISEDLKPAPDFTWTDLKGKKHRLYDTKNKVIIINFWATWCAPCVKEFPQMVDLAKTKLDKTIFIFLSVDENKDDIIRFLKKYGDEEYMDNIYIGWDQNKEISQSIFGTQKYPESFVLTPRHVIVEKMIEANINWTAHSMKTRIDDIYYGR